MVVGVLFFGMLVGAISSCYWIMTGGSFLLAFALYSGVATLIVLTVAIAAFLWSELRGTRSAGDLDLLPAE